ncbi:MAG: hypothetical protein JXR34_13485 [Bacteroidales bacterium]|nr:hypothetical protein [Bacteroidales bacterium]
MFKMILGFLLAFIGFAFLFFSVIMITTAHEGVEVAVYVIFSLINSLIAFLGVKLLIKSSNALTKKDLDFLRSEELLMSYQVEGRIWDDFKAKKCSITRMIYGSIIFGLIVGLAVYLVVFGESQDGVDSHPERSAIIGAIFGLALAAVGQYLNSYKIYGRLNKFDKGEIKIFQNHIELNDEIIPLNAMGFYLNVVKIEGKKLDRFLVFYRGNYNRRKLFVRNIWFPLIDEKLNEAQDIILILNHKSS